MKIADTEWAEEANRDALWIVENVKWPWTDRQKRIWFIGVLSTSFERDKLENATLEELQEMHKDWVGNR